MNSLVLNTVSDGSSLKTEGDFDLINRLLRNPRYNIPERLRAKCIQCIEDVLDSGTEDVGHGLHLKAIQTMVSLDKINVEIIKIAVPKKIETNVKSMNDEELLALVKDVVKRLPSFDTEK